MDEENTTGVLGGLLDAGVWLVTQIAMAFYNLGYAVTHPQLWLDWSNPEAIMRVVFYGGSVEFFFVVFTTVLVLTGVGLWRNSVLWGGVIALEGFANALGRLAAWVGLIMVLQQIVIVFVQRIFAASEISLGFGQAFTFDVSWWSEELKLYNAMIVALCVSYTFVQHGHVRVDVFYASARFRTRKIVDMVGALIFMMPVAIVTWMYGWYFLWRHLITPKPSASEGLDRLLMKARAFRWNVETIGFSPNGFNAYFLFKILLVAFAGLVFLQAVAVLWRSYLELREGEESEGKHLDRDTLSGSTTESAEHVLETR
ncbi:TRAP transporter small permease subunit [Rhodosalinus sp.]|uniref:TRAP transporter small permease subunit n=1 Tax=Rhodosalinus sp. TaxID=2047741 RepID=UPI0035689851